MRDIAIVGMGCRFPGARDLQEYWRLLLAAEPQFRSVPLSRWDHAPYLDRTDRRAAGKSYSDRVAFVDDIDRFDAAYFRMSPRRLRVMDPQHRLLLDVTREAVQDAGWDREFEDRARAGVFFAMSNSEYAELSPDARELQAYSVPGNLLNMAATTVSQHYDLGGPSFTIDAACSSGLVALHEAVTHLRTGVCTRALVGAAYLNVIPHSLVGFSKVGALSTEGVCRPFDERADGFVLGEGVAVVVLRPLQDALTDGDHIYAVIRGTGCANDGTTDGPMTPQVEGQCLAMERAYTDAGVNPRTVTLLEAHGTATPVGDRVELESLSRTRAVEPGDPLCQLTSVKALIGHSLTSSGLAGLVKVALALDHGVVPPQPATQLDAAALASAGLQVPDRALPWPAVAGGAPRRAGLNSFGFGGTNVHVVLEQAPPGHPACHQPARPELFLLSAGSVDLLVGHVQRLLAELPEDVSLPALAATLAGRRLLPSRLSVVAADLPELRQRLTSAAQALAAGRTGTLGEGVSAAAAPLPAAARRLAFVFPGQGSQRPGMLRDLCDRFPAFRSTQQALDDVVKATAGFSATKAVHGTGSSGDEGVARLRSTQVCQPVLGVLALSVVRLLADARVRPDLTLGHSVGEFSAASAAGALDARDAVRMLAARGAAMAGAETADAGGMMLVQADPAVLAAVADGVEGLWPACDNHPRQTTFSGTPAALDVLEERCRAAGATARRLEVSHAFHSPLLDGVREPVRAGLREVPLTAPGTTFVSSVSGAVCEDPEQLRELWAHHASAPVRFAAAVTAAYDAGARVFLQVTGGRSLLRSVRQNLLERDDCTYVAVSADEPDEGRSLLGALGQLAVLGVPVDLTGLGLPQQVLSLPPSPLLTASYWLPASRVTTTAPVVPAPVLVAAVPPLVPHPHPEAPVQEILSLFREQLALLRAYEPAPGGAPVALPVPATLVPAVAVPAVAVPVVAAVPAPAQPVVAVQLAQPAEAVRTTVYARISQISGFPVEQLDDDRLIVQELGFDSLMFAELMTSFRAAWPSLASWPANAPVRPTLGEMVAVFTRLLGPTAPVVQAPVVQAPVVQAPGVTDVPTHAVVREDGLDAWSDLAEHEEGVKALGRNPYFLLHEGNAGATTGIGGRELLCFSSYNYLGLSGHPAVNDAVTAAVARYGTSVSASRFLSGDRVLHKELESELAGLLGTEDSVVMVSGHATNVGVIGHVVGPDDLIVHDELAHDSILQGCALSGATRRPFRHNDPAALDALLTRLRPRHRRALVVVEGVYSMDGDIADLPALVKVKDRHGAVLMVDEAHSIGTLGKSGGGIGDHFGIERGAVDLWSGTLSKSLASCGGYVGGTNRLVDYLKYSVPGFVYSVGMTPANAAAALAAIRVMADEPARLERLRDNSALFLRLAQQAGLDTGTSTNSPVVPCIVGDSALCLALAHALDDRGISVNPIMYPGVPEELARLRFFITSEHTAEQITYAVGVLAEELARRRG